MKIIVTGSSGQLGTALKFLSGIYAEYDWIFLSRNDLDITDSGKLDIFFSKTEMSDSVIINCAAYTDVEKAEDEKEKAYLINRDGARNLAVRSLASGFKLIHLSTDFVFSGMKGSPYIEDDIPEPVSVYGKSKYAGEQEILTIPDNCLVVRTSWLYSTTHNTFVRKIYSRLKAGKPFSVVLDETGSPTNVDDLASALIKIIEKIKSVKNFRTDILHFCNSGEVSRYYLAKKIAEYAGSGTSIQPILSDELNMKAERPHNSALDCERTVKEFGLGVRSWDKALKEAVDKING